MYKKKVYFIKIKQSFKCQYIKKIYNKQQLNTCIYIVYNILIIIIINNIL